ncbi:phage virion morphogenesis protein [Bacteroides sp. RTP21281st1_E4_RTP21281_210402]|uniref:phage virion morphogenesis protein n=1 Tax=unclassified Bacteroides TaxID=2646097 RepID=UPI0034A5680B
MKPDYRELSRICASVEHAISIIPQKAAVIAVNFSKERFIKKNWVDTTETPWKKTKKLKGSTLVKSGRLKRSIRKVYVGANYVIIGTDVPYARIHNDGGTIEGTEQVRPHQRRAHKRKAYTRSGKRIKAGTIRAHTVKSHKRKFKRTFIQRKFIGQSEHLTNQLTSMIQTEIQKAIGI